MCTPFQLTCTAWATVRESLREVNPRPRVVHVSPALFGPQGLLGGGERYALELSRAMAERVPTTLVSFDSAPRVEQAGRLEIRVLRNWLPFRRFAVDPLNPALLSELAHAGIIHYHQTRTMLSSLALLYARTRRIPIYGTSLGGGGLALPREVP